VTEADNKVTSRSALEWVMLNRTKVSLHAQRELNPARVARLVADFDPELLEIPTLSLRDGCYYIIDGHHRIAALKEWIGPGWETQQLRCRVYRDLTEAQEAEFFDRLNDRLIVRAYDKYRVRVNAGRPIETAVEEEVHRADLVTSKSGGPGSIQAVNALVRVYCRTDGQTLGRALRIIRDAYGDVGFQGPVIDGIGLLCQRYNGVLDEDAAVQRLAGARGGLAGLLNRAEQERKQTGSAKSHSIAAAAVDLINQGKGGKKLPSWWKT